MSDTPAEIFATFSVQSLQAWRRDLKCRVGIEGTHPMLVTEYQDRLAEVEAELEVRARRRDAEFAGVVARATLLLLCICSLAGMTGCVTTADSSGPMDFATTEARNRQVALTGLIALDTAQTASFSKSDCLREINPIAVAIYGTDRPSSQRVLITGALYITGHWLLASYLDRKAERPIDLSISATEDMARRSRWRFMRGLYQGLTMIGHGAAVVSNQVKGIRPFSSYECGGAR